MLLIVTLRFVPFTAPWLRFSPQMCFYIPQRRSSSRRLILPLSGISS